MPSSVVETIRHSAKKIRREREQEMNKLKAQTQQHQQYRPIRPSPFGF